MSDVLSIGLSGTVAAERALQTTGHNISNANTPGFSRQRVSVDTRAPQLTGVGALGSGVQVTDIGRMHDDFVVGDLRRNATIAQGLQTNYDFTSQIDNMLADPEAGLAPTLQQFFKAINGVANDPSSQSARQVLLGEANSLGERFSYLNNRFDTLRKGANENLKSNINEVNDLAQGLADINWKIVLAKGTSHGEPNDLLDQRERLLQQLAEKIDVRTTQQEDGALNIFIGNGQTLVLGKHAAQLQLKGNEHDPSKLDVVYRNMGADAVVTKFLKGGSIGGLLDFRENLLDSSQNELGRIAIGVAKTFNDQHHKGMTLRNELGGDFFNDIDKTAPLTLPRGSNKGDYELKTMITNVDNLTTSDYMLNYNEGKYTLIRALDDKIIGTYDSLPQQVSSEGFKIQLERGSKIENGDSFLIRPTRAAAMSFGVNIKDTANIAAAAPVRIRTSVHNMGNAKPELTSVADTDTPSFKMAEGTLSPTITVRFMDDHHLELLDSDGKVIKTQQLNDQSKAIPATPAVPGEKGTPATPATPAIPASGNHHDKDHDTGNDDEPGTPTIESGIAYDPKVGINLFPTPDGLNPGYSVRLSGEAKAGDTFVIEYNKDAVGNNVNALALGDLQAKPTLSHGTSNYMQTYSQLVSRVGSKTHELDVNRQAQNILYEQAKAAREAVSGVNLDEEAANLVRYQQHYKANAQVVGAANEMFNTLMGILRR